jgi:hypothetical protein
VQIAFFIFLSLSTSIPALAVKNQPLQYALLRYKVILPFRPVDE